MFYKLPLPLKRIAFNIASWKIKRERYKGNFNLYLNWFKSKEKQTSFKKPNVPLSKEVEILYGDKKRNFEDYSIINKQWVKSRINEVDYYSNVKFDGVMHTSGSTGSALKVPYDRDFLRYKYAASWYFREIHNLSINVPNCNFTGRLLFDVSNGKPPYWLWGSANKQLLCSQYHLSDESVDSYLNAFFNYGIKWLHGYPSVLNLFAHLIQKNDLVERALELSIVGISVSSESLNSKQRKLIEETFGCKVYNYYGQAESVVDIFECEAGNLHINEDFSYVEFKEVGDDLYRLIGTQLKNNSFPLIRYDTGDLVEYKGKMTCTCGRNSRIVERIIGRSEDVLTLRDGRKIGRLDHLFKHSSEIVEAQIIQTRPGEAVWKIVTGARFTRRDEELIINEIKSKLGTEFNYEIEYVDSIERSSSGKFKQVISTL